MPPLGTVPFGLGSWFSKPQQKASRFHENKFWAFGILKFGMDWPGLVWSGVKGLSHMSFELLLLKVEVEEEANSELERSRGAEVKKKNLWGPWLSFLRRMPMFSSFLFLLTLFFGLKSKSLAVAYSL